MAKKRKVRGFIPYKSYSFVNKDPIIDVFRTARADSGQTFQQVADASGVNSGTLRNWERGNVRRPAFSTVAAALKATGQRYIDLGGNGKATPSASPKKS